MTTTAAAAERADELPADRPLESIPAVVACHLAGLRAHLATFDAVLEDWTTCMPPAAQPSRCPAPRQHPESSQPPPPFAGQGGPTYAPAPSRPAPPCGHLTSMGQGGFPSSALAASGPASFGLSLAAPAHGASAVGEAGSQLARGKKPERKFLSQPLHAYVSGEDCASVPRGSAWLPPCGCKNHGPADYNPGPHATWDCLLRYIQRYGSCPGFHTNGMRDSAQWLGGNILTKEAKNSRMVLIKDLDLPLAQNAGAPPPPFHK